MLTGGGRRAAGALAAVIVLAALPAAGCRRSARGHTTVEASGETVRIDLRSVPSASGRFFSFRSSDGGRVDFLVYRESGGEPRAVLDACADCYRWRKGYRLEGDAVVCAKCGLRFRLDEVKDGIGACVPIPLPATHGEDWLEIRAAALEAATKYF
jgi:uncharacterized membrane protein